MVSDLELAERWRRHFTALDTLVYGFLRAERDRRAGRDLGPAAVTLADLSGARHALSAARFHPDSQLRAWQQSGMGGHNPLDSSDPASPWFAGSLEADLQQARSELDARFE